MSPQIDDAVDQGGAKVIVAYNVEKFELEYRSDREQDEWVNQWRSDNKGRADHTNRFPHFVKVTLELSNQVGEKTKTIGHSMIVHVAFPNNESHLQQQQAAARGRQQGVPR
jgi:hypothetical protein